MKGLSSLSLEKPCDYADLAVPHGAELCDGGKCMICDDGKLQDYFDPKAPKYGLLISVGPA